MKIEINVKHQHECNHGCVSCVVGESNSFLNNLLRQQKKGGVDPHGVILCNDIDEVDPVIKYYADQMVCIGCGLKQNICKESCGWNKQKVSFDERGKVVHDDSVPCPPFEGFVKPTKKEDYIVKLFPVKCHSCGDTSIIQSDGKEWKPIKKDVETTIKPRPIVEFDPENKFLYHDQEIVKARKVFYTVYGRLPKKGDKLTLADSLEYKRISDELSYWAMASGFEKKPI